MRHPRRSLLAAALLLAMPAAAQRGTGSVTDHPTTAILAAAKEIDRLVEAGLAAHGLRANPPADDNTFVRRVYLDIVGRIPTFEEATTFLATRDIDKRRKLVDQLLDAPGHDSHMFNYWADLLRTKTRLTQQTSGEPYIHWIKQALADNKRYDQFVSELLTATGPAHERANGATGYTMRDRGMPEDNMANTVRVFLGTRLECAQCHNHPFDKWKQKQFYEMAAFTGGVDYRTDEVLKNLDSPLGRIAREMRQGGNRMAGADANAGRALRNMLRNVTSGVKGTGTGAIPLPKEYQYDDAKPEQLVTAKTLFGDSPAITVQQPNNERKPRGRRRPANRRQRGPSLPEIDTRSLYATWLTSADNPHFAKVIANRMWKRAFGRGVIEPVDDLKDDTVAANPALMDYLEKLVVDLAFDLDQFQRVLFHTKTYQRSATTTELQAGEVYHFPGPLLRRMSAEQIWDSMMTLVIHDLDSQITAPGEGAEKVYQRYEEFLQMSEPDLRALVDREKLRYTDPEAYQEARRQERQQERMALGESSRKNGRAAQREIQALRQELRGAKKYRDNKRVAELTEQLAALTKELKQKRRPRLGTKLARASDLPSPAPAGHFLQQFGQSDREQIEAANTDANVPQVLTLLNGIIADNVTDRSAALMHEIAAQSTNRAKVEAAFLTMLSRPPNRAEMKLFGADLEQSVDRGVHDLIWTLANTHEFRFIQ